MTSAIILPFHRSDYAEDKFRTRDIQDLLHWAPMARGLGLYLHIDRHQLSDRDSLIGTYGDGAELISVSRDRPFGPIAFIVRPLEGSIELLDGQARPIETFRHLGDCLHAICEDDFEDQAATVAYEARCSPVMSERSSGPT